MANFDHLFVLILKITGLVARNPSMGAKIPSPERVSVSSKPRKSITISHEVAINPPSQMANHKNDDLKYINNADQGKPAKMKSNDLVSGTITASPPLPKDGNAEDMNETIKLLQLKVQRMSELLELKNEKLVKLESNSQGSSQTSLRMRK